MTATTTRLAAAVGASADEPLGPWFRQVPDLGADRRVGDLGTLGLSVTDLLWPTVTLRESALAGNLEAFAAWCAEQGVDHAPHGKTSLSPQLISRQLDAGCWAITAATVAQTRLYHRWGVPRVILANQVVDPAGLAWLRHALDTDPTFEVYVLADSVAGVEQLGTAFAGSTRDLPVLVELGVEAGRAGCRDLPTALTVARAITAAPGLRPAGIECFEGVHPQDRAESSLRLVDALVRRLGEFLVEADAQGLFAGADEVVLTGGGSAYPDRVAAVSVDLPPLSVPVRRVIRSGGYVTHDHAMLARSSPLADRLRPALELWAHVLSRPEPGSAIVGFGKRDAAYDVDLPIPLARIVDGERRPLDGVTVAKLNDQHAFLSGEPEALDDLAVGDAVLFGLSHPCTVFDKWPLIPVIDDDDRVVDGCRTYF